MILFNYRVVSINLFKTELDEHVEEVAVMPKDFPHLRDTRTPCKSGLYLTYGEPEERVNNSLRIFLVKMWHGGSKIYIIKTNTAGTVVNSKLLLLIGDWRLSNLQK